MSQNLEKIFCRTKQMEKRFGHNTKIHLVKEKSCCFAGLLPSTATLTAVRAGFIYTQKLGLGTRVLQSPPWADPRSRGSSAVPSHRPVRPQPARHGTGTGPDPRAEAAAGEEARHGPSARTSPGASRKPSLPQAPPLASGPMGPIQVLDGGKPWASTGAGQALRWPCSEAPATALLPARTVRSRAWQHGAAQESDSSAQGQHRRKMCSCGSPRSRAGWCQPGRQSAGHRSPQTRRTTGQSLARDLDSGLLSCGPGEEPLSALSPGLQRRTTSGT